MPQAEIPPESHHSQRLERWREQLSAANALPLQSFLGLLIGVISGVVIVIFRFLVEIPLSHWLPVHTENFEALPRYWHFLIPFLGAILLGLTMQFIDKKYHGTSVGHVLDRIHNHQGRLPLGNALFQLIGGAWCLITGQSVGREGPAVHLGASSGSLLGQWLHLPNNSLRPLAGCGVAAAIAACFNTPLAGVIFAMEVVVMEYSIAGFIPVIVAAVAGTTITQSVFGNAIALHAPNTGPSPLEHLPILAATGLAIGLLAAAYVFIHSQVSTKSTALPVWIKFTLVGLIAGTGAYIAPQIMGVGYDTIASAIDNQLLLPLLLTLVVAKLLITSISLGAGMPGGVIGPLLFIGACAGGAIGSLAQLYLPDFSSPVGFYVILGMGAMMGAALNAPLAAMMTILELTYSPAVIFPSMIVVVIASLTTRWGFGFNGLFQTVLSKQGKKSSFSLAEQVRVNHGILHLLDKSVVVIAQPINTQDISELLQQDYRWFIFPHRKCAVDRNVLQQLIEQQNIDLLWETPQELPVKTLKLIELDRRCHLQHALNSLQQAGAEAAWVHLPRQHKSGLLLLSALVKH